MLSFWRVTRLLPWQLLVPKDLQEETAGSLQRSAEKCVASLYCILLAKVVTGQPPDKGRGNEKIIKEFAAIFNPTHQLKLVVSLPLKAGIILS